MSRSAPLPVRTDRDPLALRSSARSRNDCSVTSYTSSKSCGVSWIRSGTFVSIRLDLLPGIVAQRVDLDLAVEMADAADDGSVLHMPHVVDRDHVDVAGRGDKDVALCGGLVHRGRSLPYVSRQIGCCLLAGGDGGLPGDDGFPCLVEAAHMRVAGRGKRLAGHPRLMHLQGAEQHDSGFLKPLRIGLRSHRASPGIRRSRFDLSRCLLQRFPN